MARFRLRLHDLVSVEGSRTLAAQREFPSPPAQPAELPETTTGRQPREADVRLGAGAAPPKPTAAPTPPAKESIGVFLTPQSLLTFPVASGAVILIWRVLSAVFPSLGPSKLVPLVTAFLVGTFIYYISLPENASTRVRITGAGIGIINSFFLAASALGVDIAT